MIPLSLYKIASILNIEYIGKNVVIHNISIHSNCIKNQCMFIALIGNRYDGHDFAKLAMSHGAVALLVNRYLFLDVPQLVVVDTHIALMEIAKWIRQKVSVKVVAITGSTGKTSVKEMTASILRRCGKVESTPGNYNNLIGVPMTLLNLTYQNDFAVVELGTNRIGELNQLSKIVTADVALVNNISISHMLGFGSLSMIRKEKGEIFSGLSCMGQAVLNVDSHALSVWNFLLKYKKIWLFSVYKTIGVDFFASNIVLYTYGVQFILHSPLGVIPIFLSVLGYHNVANALAASALAFAVGASLSDIVYGLQDIQALPGRLFPMILNQGKLLLLDDTYNSNVGSMIAAINVLHTMPGNRILVVSDMLELGESKTILYHRYIGQLITKTNIDYVLTIGNFSHVISEMCENGKHFQSKAQLIFYLNSVLFCNKFISLLIKGSRLFCMEQIVNAIKDKSKCYFG